MLRCAYFFVIHQEGNAAFDLNEKDQQILQCVAEGNAIILSDDWNTNAFECLSSMVVPVISMRTKANLELSIFNSDDHYRITKTVMKPAEDTNVVKVGVFRWNTYNHYDRIVSLDQV